MEHTEILLNSLCLLFCLMTILNGKLVKTCQKFINYIIYKQQIPICSYSNKIT